jgi:hypothetical protein
MKRYAWLILIAAFGCTPQYESGKTQCSDAKECPSGYSCSDDGTSGIHYCVDNETVKCPDTSTFYCSQSKTCWAKPAACATAVKCDSTTKHPGWLICVSLGYHPDCNGDSCIPNGAVPDAGSSKGGSGGSGGVGGRGGSSGTGGALIGRGGSSGTGGRIVTGGVTVRGGTYGSGGSYRTGGTTGRGGSLGTGGSTSVSSSCSGTPNSCSSRYDQAECQFGTGCTWNTTTEICSGSVYSCSRYTSGTTCILNGCDWSGPMVCESTPITSLCSSMEASTPCEVCMYGSCCGQMLDCFSDTACGETSSGPLWTAYLDCVVNCCYGSCLQ